ncbi:Pbi1p Ecym_3011 [Eremothecium cymbalariae DBVPG|uniref:Alcohol acetyltransferase n=1 Tax=Eremothecium cymbalariae (strain CBS 270.75 / DBVPG 7215 / KCTC 17166 / NRRL Y-17582) TaxID=931890 RepID=G8JQW1_ERECY|nr:Hypothetical protein Ecym_3011 [Eremothecium cymbalariae DBVPG\
MATIASSIRDLSSVEKIFHKEVYTSRRNGIVFAVNYSSNKCESERWSDDITLSNLRDSRLFDGQISNALEAMIKENVELCVTITDDRKFAPTEIIRYDDVVIHIEFKTYKDELIECQNGIPPYILRNILENNKFEFGRPLWELIIVDYTMVILHCHEVMFDLFAAANFHLKFQKALSQFPKDTHALDILFVYEGNELQLSKTNFDGMSQISVSPVQSLPLQCISVLKGAYRTTVKKSLNVIRRNFVANNQITTYESSKSDVFKSMFNPNTLCGTTVSGSLNAERLASLLELTSSENVCMTSVLCAITLLSLKPLIRKFNGSITFVVPIDIREKLEIFDLGVSYTNLMVECPLSFINDKDFQHTVSDGNIKSLHKIDPNSPDYPEMLLEYQFKQLTSHVMNSLKEKKQAWQKRRFDMSSLKGKKLRRSNKIIRGKFIEINLVDMGEAQDGQFHTKNVNFTSSLGSKCLISVSCAILRGVGMNIFMHYPESNDMDAFVECFQILLEDLAKK